MYDKINKYLITRQNQNIKLTTNEYDKETNFVILYNFSNEQETRTDLSILKDYKDYLIKLEMLVVASINLEVIQVKKNLELYKKNN